MKHRFRNLGALTIAVFALLVIGAQAASAAEPEYVGNLPMPFESTSGAGVLETTGGTPVNCASDRNEGELLNGKEDEVTVFFEGCEALGFPCTTAGQPSGTIKSGPLNSYLVDLVGGGVGDLLYPQSESFPPAEPPNGSTIAQFTCLIVPVTVRGSVLGEFATTNEATTENELILNQSEGEQEFTEYETESGEVRGAHLESSIAGGAFEESGEATEDTIETAEPVEVRG